MDPLFLTLDEVLEIHAQQIELYGGSDGVRDPAGLESAVATPMATFGGEFLHSSLPSMAAAYLFHICQNHPFVDGNKRTGANAAITFLLINDWGPKGGRINKLDKSGDFRYRRVDDQIQAPDTRREPLAESSRYAQ
jgi:death-on-curing family protein